jgi:hypothetical protein
MDPQHTIASLGVGMVFLAYLPAIVALFRGKIGICVVMIIVLTLNMLLAITIVGIPFAVIAWFSLLIASLIVGYGRTTVLVQQPDGTLTRARGPSPMFRGWKASIAILAGLIMLGFIVNNSDSHKMTAATAAVTRTDSN